MFIDPSGHNGEAIMTWSGTMWWLTLVDGPLPVGDIVYAAGSLVAGAVDAINCIGVENIANFACEVANEAKNLYHLAKDKVSEVAQKMSSPFKKLFGGGGSAPNDPNNWNHRDYYLNQVENKSMKNLIDQIYRPKATIGDGGTADALRFEFDNDLKLSHLQKATDRIKEIQNILKTQNLTEKEVKIAYELLNDLYDAVKYVGGNIK